MKTKEVTINDKKYNLIIADTEELRNRGLRNIEKLPASKGMLFVWNEPQEVSMTMQDTKIPLHQIFIDEDGEILKEAIREDINQNVLISCDNTKYVIEINPDNTIQEGDYVEGLVDEKENSKTPIMKVLAPDGSTQMELQGGERIFSRKSTLRLIKWAKRSNKSKLDKDYKRLGTTAFKELYAQDHRDAEYVTLDK